MLFDNPVFYDFRCITVRKGKKWMKVRLHDTLSIQGRNGEEIAVATVVGKALLPFSLCTNGLLELEHDPKCRTRKGLYKSLKKSYPKFNAGDLVTIIWFKIASE